MMYRPRAYAIDDPEVLHTVMRTRAFAPIACGVDGDVRFAYDPVAVDGGEGQDPQKQSSQVGRIFRRFHAHGLIAKIPRTRRWRVTLYGRRVMGAALYLREQDSPRVYSTIAA